MLVYAYISNFDLNHHLHVFDPRMASPSPRGQANPSRFFMWVTGFVLPWTHQESGAISRPVVHSS
ncbi:hypothetical protein Hanom_Chr16g01417841 [Helianthus anomalus]